MVSLKSTLVNCSRFSQKIDKLINTKHSNNRKYDPKNIT